MLDAFELDLDDRDEEVGDDLPAPEIDPRDEVKGVVALKGAKRLTEALRQIIAKLDGLKGVEGVEGVDELRKMTQAVLFDFGRLVAWATRAKGTRAKDDSLLVLKQHWRLHEKNLDGKHIHFLHRILGIPQKDIAILLGVTPPAIQVRLNRYQEKLLPHDVDPEGLDEDEKAALVLRKIYAAATSDKVDRESVNAAKVFLELYQKRVERGAVEKWKQVEILAEFFFSRLVPAIHQQLSMAGAKLDIRAVCLPLFEEVNQDIRAVLEKVKLSPPEPKKKGRPRKDAGK